MLVGHLEWGPGSVYSDVGNDPPALAGSFDLGSTAMLHKGSFMGRHPRGDLRASSITPFFRSHSGQNPRAVWESAAGHGHFPHRDFWTI